MADLFHSLDCLWGGSEEISSNIRKMKPVSNDAGIRMNVIGFGPLSTNGEIIR